MCSVWIGKIERGKINFGQHNTAAIHDWSKKNEGVVVRLETSINPVSDQMRGYYFSPFMSWLKELVPQWKSLSSDELHEVLKKQFNYFEAYNAITKRNERFGQSVMSNDKRNKMAIEYIMKITDWAMENYGQSLPDSEAYKRWSDSAPLID